jgi:hypothetical protein
LSFLLFSRKRKAFDAISVYVKLNVQNLSALVIPEQISIAFSDHYQLAVDLDLYAVRELIQVAGWDRNKQHLFGLHICSLIGSFDQHAAHADSKG